MPGTVGVTKPGDARREPKERTMKRFAARRCWPVDCSRPAGPGRCAHADLNDVIWNQQQQNRAFTWTPPCTTAADLARPADQYRPPPPTVAGGGVSMAGGGLNPQGIGAVRVDDLLDEPVAPAALTLYWAGAILPFSSTRNVERMTPCTVLPYIFFSPNVPQAVRTVLSGRPAMGTSATRRPGTWPASPACQARCRRRRSPRR